MLPLPHRTQLFTPQDFAGQAPIAEVQLQVGDLLYLPRGYIHSTTTSDSFSAHVTVGITVYTWVDLVKEFLATAIDDVEMRAALPPGFARSSDLQPVLRKKMRAALDTLNAKADTDQLLQSFASRVRAAQVRRPPPFRADVTVIDLASHLQLPAPESYKIIQEGEKTLLEFKGTRYHMPLSVASIMLAISKRQSFRPSEFSAHLNSADILGLSRQLVDMGFLTIASADCRSFPPA